MYYQNANPSEGKRLYVRKTSPPKRRRARSTDRVVRQNAGRHRFDKRPRDATKKKKYDYIVRKWSSANCEPAPTSWMGAARMFRRELLMGKGRAISATSGEFAFLLLDSKKPKSGKFGGAKWYTSAKVTDPERT